jgi:predicted nuclease of restriction endonuclease-like (RecB) superfamily
MKKKFPRKSDKKITRSKMTEMLIDKSYRDVFEKLKKDILQSQLRAALAVTKELTLLYWRIGKVLSIKTENEGWGAKTLERLARDLKSEFPDVNGFSFRNLKYMRQFAQSYPDSNWAATAAQIPWGHNMLLLDKVSDPKKRLWYIQEVIKGGWSRSALEDWIDSDLYNRKGKALTNFKDTLPMPQSELAEEILKEPVNLGFLTLSAAHKEIELEQGLMDHLQKFLVELGEGFAFMGRQFQIEVEGKTHFIDLLFYHVPLRCYVVVELKARAFDPRDAGQMNFYLSAIDDLLKRDDEQPTIGILLCKRKNKVEVEYALRNSRSPIGIASYKTTISKKLPKEFMSSLPTVEEIEAELSTINILEGKPKPKAKKTKRTKKT